MRANKRVPRLTSNRVQFEIPPELGAVFVQVSGCGLGADGQPAPTPAQGAEAADVKAFLSFTTPKPSVWEAQHRLSWCSDEPTLLDRAKGTIPQPANATSPTVLHISVYASAPSQFTLAVTRSMSSELVLNELSTYVIKCRKDGNSREFFASKMWSPFNASRSAERGSYGHNFVYGRPCTPLYVQVPAASRAIVVRAQAQQLPSPPPLAVQEEYNRQYGYYGSRRGRTYEYQLVPLPLGAGLSMTATNLTVLPATWAMVLSGSISSNSAQSRPIAEHGELFISRSSPGFCRVEPCQLTIQLFAMDRGTMEEPNATFSVTIGVFDASDEPAPASAYKLDVPLTAKTRSRQRSSCAPGCEPDFVADGVCHEACLTPACRDDGGDCALRGGSNPFCAPGCRHEFISDGVCDDACFVSSCNWDGHDCTTAIRAQRYTYQELLEEEATNDDAADMAPPPPPPLTP